jgi:hypothetical protein
MDAQAEALKSGLTQPQGNEKFATSSSDQVVPVLSSERVQCGLLINRAIINVSISKEPTGDELRR